MGVLLGLDVGTSGVRAIAMRPEDGELVAQASASYGVATPRPGWTEQDPVLWSDASRQVLAEVAAQVGGAVDALGLAGQMHGSVFLDARERVIRPALLWNDQRTSRQVAEIVEAVGAERLVRATGNPALTGFTAPKVLWLRDHEPDHYARVRSLLLPKDYVRLVLTGDHATDVSDASGTQLLDPGTRAWSGEILDALQIPRSWLPALHEGTETTGTLLDSMADELGLPRGLPVAAGGGDNAAAAVGAGVGAPGQVSVSVGTSGVVFAPTPGYAPDPTGRVHAFCHAIPDAYHLMAVTLSAGGSLAWWRAQHPSASFDELVAEAAAVRPGAEGLVFLPYLTGERTPHLDPDARGAFIGLNVRHGRAAMTRAVMEGVALSLRDGLEVVRSLGVAVDDLRAVGGGARSPTWRRLLADVFGLPLQRTAVDEGPAYGAALLAGVAAGTFATPEEAMTRVRVGRDVTEPDDAAVAFYAERHELFAELYGPLRTAMHRLADSTYEDEVPLSP